MSQRTLTDAERLDWLRLIRSDRIGPRTFRALVTQFGSAAAAIDALPDLSRRAGRGCAKICSSADAEREIAALARLGGRFIAQGEPDYPTPLLAIETAPPLIAVRGSSEAICRPIVAVVGSRNASAAGGVFTERLARHLGEAGYVVASGLARGIDARAHHAALQTGTIAVLAGGHDRIYPNDNRPLLDAILGAGGAAISEMPIGWEPRGRDFPRRNRIVSGLSYGVVVVEAARRSGSLITARFALEQGREVFAVPGSPLDPRSEGTNDLIKGGATLCASADDVVGALAPLVKTFASDRPPWPKTIPGFSAGDTYFWDEFDTDAAAVPRIDDRLVADADSDRRRVISALSFSPLSIDELSRQASVPVRAVQLVIVELELRGQIERHGANAVSLVPQPD